MKTVRKIVLRRPRKSDKTPDDVEPMNIPPQKQAWTVAPMYALSQINPNCKKQSIETNLEIITDSLDILQFTFFVNSS